MRSVVEIGASVPAFLGKLWKLVNDTETNHLISWSPGGKTFVIKNQADFARELLPLYYKHNNMASFIRQLNMYGFHKITSVENGGLRYEKDEIEFSHPCFMKGHVYLLEHIKRKIANPKSLVSSEAGDKLIKPELMNKVLSDVKSMKGKQETLDVKFSAMKQENEALWREVAILRQKHIKQQQIVNNLIQFLCNLVQPGRGANPSSNNVGVKRPYQLMIHNTAHNSATDGSYPGRLKNVKLDKDVLLDDINDENMEDGPTIHELAHDDILHGEITQDTIIPSEYVSVRTPSTTRIVSAQSPTDPNAQVHYQVTMEDGDDPDLATRMVYPVNIINGPRANEKVEVMTNSPTVRVVTTPTEHMPIVSNNVAPSTSKEKRNSNHSVSKSSNNFHSLNPVDLKLPAEIFASDDSVSDAGLPANDDIINALQEFPEEPSSVSKDKMLGGINIKLEKPDTPNPTKKAKKSKSDSAHNLNLADIKTELQDDLDWNNMTLATVPNNNVSRFQSRNRRDNNSKNREDFSYYGTNTNNEDIDDHLDAMQTDLESLRELLRSDSYSLDANTLMGLFGSDDPFYGLAFNNQVDERTNKTTNNGKKQKDGFTSGDATEQLQDDHDDVDGNQLISYTGNIPDFEDISIPDLECDNSLDGPLSPLPGGSTLNTPLIQLNSPSYGLSSDSQGSRKKITRQ